MSTKTEGDGCYNSALPDEPMFTLLARDPTAPKFVMEWAKQRLADVEEKRRPPEDRQQVSEAVDLAQRMISWREDNLNRWRNASGVVGGVQNAERQAMLRHIDYRIELYSQREAVARTDDEREMFKSAKSALGVLRGDIVAAFHITGKAVHPADHLGETSIDLPAQQEEQEPDLSPMPEIGSGDE